MSTVQVLKTVAFLLDGAMEDRRAGQIEGGADRIATGLHVRGNERRRVQFLGE